MSLRQYHPLSTKRRQDRSAGSGFIDQKGDGDKRCHRTGDHRILSAILSILNKEGQVYADPVCGRVLHLLLTVPLVGMRSCLLCNP